MSALSRCCLGCRGKKLHPAQLETQKSCRTQPGGDQNQNLHCRDASVTPQNTSWLVVCVKRWSTAPHGSQDEASAVFKTSSRLCCMCRRYTNSVQCATQQTRPQTTTVSPSNLWLQPVVLADYHMRLNAVQQKSCKVRGAKPSWCLPGF